ncbi:MAG TPA: DUF503 domain-containing protein [Candidatus Limnocylindrales bacterium]|nr:DUF503 domain-containing protein [Candidatus Limnocylindrales bacterium]
MVIGIRVAVCVLELHIPMAGSLKAKRQVIKSLIQRLRNHFNISIAEVGNQDLWQRAELGVAAVCYNGAGADSIMERIFSYIEQENNVSIISCRKENY